MLCRGWAETRKVFEALSVDAETDSLTIGGFMAEQVGRMPKVGDEVSFGPLKLKVLQASARRAEAVEVRRVVPEEDRESNP